MAAQGKTVQILLSAFRFAAYLILVLLTKLLQLLSYERLVKISGGLGRIAYKVMKNRRHHALMNIQYALQLDKPETDALLRRVFRHFARMFLEIPYFLNNPKPLPLKLHSPDVEHVKRSLARGKGVVMLTAHIGNWEWGTRFLSLNGLPTQAVARHLHNPYVDKWITAAREVDGIKILFKSRGVEENRKIIDVLKANNVICFVADQYVSKGVKVPFFDHAIETPSGPYRMARMTGAAVHVGYIIHHNGTYEGRISPKIELVRTNDKEADMFENTRRFNAELEKIIRENPEQWFWFHNRWRLYRRKARRHAGHTAAAPIVNNPNGQ